MKIFVFGNEDLPQDSLPLKILPELKKLHPQTDFVVLDPNEEWDMPEDVTVIDTVLGIQAITVFTDFEKFEITPNLTMHDFDALSNLRYLKKLGKIKNIKIIGVPALSLSNGPPMMDEKETIQEISKIIRPT